MCISLRLSYVSIPKFTVEYHRWSLSHPIQRVLNGLLVGNLLRRKAPPRLRESSTGTLQGRRPPRHLPLHCDAAAP
ncbi:hypothetical protein WFH_00073 [Escherichia phage vB_EcoM_WFH]|uniref:Uncharacterized protein n=1 Tax=Escherichia phage vB_EcoM_WFH TaxID=2508192 RepID=A0A482MTH7_9CAUD|nr:hypothetical protein HOV51_gp074 [Escherichia phage vB_EcoM_WFH]QBQ77361.1 hypothetical protein WFH_00073 [Escherichia phage vB_EcoM_WFH]